MNSRRINTARLELILVFLDWMETSARGNKILVHVKWSRTKTMLFSQMQGCFCNFTPTMDQWTKINSSCYGEQNLFQLTINYWTRGVDNHDSWMNHVMYGCLFLTAIEFSHEFRLWQWLNLFKVFRRLKQVEIEVFFFEIEVKLLSYAFNDYSSS